MIGYTTIEQSRKLFELGINVDTADMCFDLISESEWYGYPISKNLCSDDILGTLVPCWSTEALLDILDETIVFGTEEDCHEYTLHLGKDGTSYYMYYEDTEFVANNIVDELDFSCSTLLNCAFEMIVKLKEMKLI